LTGVTVLIHLGLTLGVVSTMALGLECGLLVVAAAVNVVGGLGLGLLEATGFEPEATGLEPPQTSV